MRVGYIYKITNPNGAIYIGQTVNLTARKYSYRTLRCKLQYKIYNSLKKYGWENHIFEVVDQTTNLNTLTDLESSYIDKYNSYYLDNREYGLNLTKYGNSTRGIICKGRKEIFVYLNNGKFFMRSDCLSCDMDKFGIKYPSSISKILDKNIPFNNYRFRSKYSGEYINPLNKIYIQQLDLNNNLINTFKSASEAARITGADRAGINKCINKIKKFNTCGGFKWIKVSNPIS